MVTLDLAFSRRQRVELGLKDAGDLMIAASPRHVAGALVIGAHPPKAGRSPAIRLQAVLRHFVMSLTTPVFVPPAALR